MCLTMSQMKLGERRATGQKEPAFTLEKRVQKILLQRAELVICQAAPLSASFPAKTPRSHADGPVVTQSRANAARLQQVK